MGESGFGKSTLLNIIAALDKPTDGDVYLDGRKFSDIKHADFQGILQHSRKINTNRQKIRSEGICLQGKLKNSYSG